MPVIAVASPKGGCGKTTTSLILSTTLAEMGASVTVFDCDRNQPLKKWRAGQSTSPIQVRTETTEDNIVDRIDEERTKVQFVVVDLEGAGSLLMSRAIGRAQFVVIPLQPSDLDADEAAKALRLIKTEEKIYGRAIDHRIVFTRTNPVIKTKIERKIMTELKEGGAPTFDVQINERQPYKALFHYRKALPELTGEEMDADSIQKAQANAQAFVEELLERMSTKRAAA